MTPEEMAQSFREAIDEAEAHAAAPQQGDSESFVPFNKGFVMGLCVGASIAGMPEEVWASPQRHARQVRCPSCGLTMAEHNRVQAIANEIRAERDLPPLDPPDIHTGVQKR